MQIHKDKQFKVLLDLQAQNLAYSQCLAEILLLQNARGDMDVLNSSISQLNENLVSKTKQFLNRLLEEYGDVDDLLNP